MKQISVIVIGAGSRGKMYSGKMNAMPEKYKVVAIAEPNDVIRRRCQREYGLSDEMCFTDWRDILARP